MGTSCNVQLDIFVALYREWVVKQYNTAEQGRQSVGGPNRL